MQNLCVSIYFIIWTVSTLQCVGQLPVINLKVSHLVLLHADLRVSMTRNSYSYSTDVYWPLRMCRILDRSWSSYQTGSPVRNLFQGPIRPCQWKLGFPTTLQKEKANQLHTSFPSQWWPFATPKFTILLIEAKEKNHSLNCYQRENAQLLGVNFLISSFQSWKVEKSCSYR